MDSIAEQIHIIENSNSEDHDDKKMQDELQMLMERLQEPNTELYLPALEALKQLIRSSTTSITSVPKPLKYMRPHYETMKNIYKNIQNKNIKEAIADIISVLAMTMGNEGDKECLSYRLLADQNNQICEWGHEYVRYLSSEISSKWQNANKKFKEKLLPLIHQIIPFTLSHNADAEACDLLMEIEELDLLLKYVDDNSYSKIFLYLISCILYVPEPENITIMQFILKMAIKYEKYIDAVRIAMMLNDCKIIAEIFEKCKDDIMKKQIAFLIARQRITIDFTTCSEEPSEKILEIVSNAYLNQYFTSLARDLDILEAKCPEDIYKSHLDLTKILLNTQADSARNNLSSSFVNAFLNTGFGNDRMFEEFGSIWIYKNKDHGMISATASLGLIKLWDIDGGLAAIDKYLYSTDDNIKAGALLACGILCCGIVSEIEPAHALLSDYLWNDADQQQICAILGIGIAYAGSNNSIALNSLRKLLENDENTEVTANIAISIGLIAVGTCNEEDVELLFDQTVWCDAYMTQFSFARSIFLGLGLLFLGCQSKCEPVIERLQGLRPPYNSYGTVIVEMCAYAGTGNVLKIQHLLHICSEHYENKETKTDKKEKSNQTENQSDENFNSVEVQMAAVIGVALISMGNDVNVDMSYRTFGHLMSYGDPGIRRVVPLAMALINISNPKPHVADMLNKFSHDNDNEVALNAIFALGLIAAGTNNARIANLLRQAAQYYTKDNNSLFIVRLAQGLVHLAKGTVTLSPYHSDHLILRPCSMAALLNIIFVAFDMKNLLLGQSHYLLYLITPAIEPRCLITFDEDLEQIQVPVRTGIAVDVVAQAGKPKTITGFQTHTTPVLLGVGERAELATDDYIPISPILEGFVIVKKSN